MKGDEEIHGPATVGGNGVRYAQTDENGYAIMQHERITGLTSEDPLPVADLTVDGQIIHFAQETPAVKKVETGKKTWVDYKDSGDHIPSLRKQRKALMNGVLSYNNYMAKKGVM